MHRKLINGQLTLQQVPQLIHTRSGRSSVPKILGHGTVYRTHTQLVQLGVQNRNIAESDQPVGLFNQGAPIDHLEQTHRSEERRVGKEWRSGMSRETGRKEKERKKAGWGSQGLRVACGGQRARD